MSIFPSSFLTLQNNRDQAIFARHAAGLDLATVCINGTITVSALIDSEADSQQFEYGSIPGKQTKIIHVLLSALGNNTFPANFDIGQEVSINGDQAWQVASVTQSADGGNMVDIVVSSRE